MNLDPASLMASLFVSSVGYIVFKYGRKQQRLPQTGIGMLIMVYPYFVPEVVWMLATLPVMLGVLWLLTRLGY